MTEVGFEGALAPGKLSQAAPPRRSSGRPVWEEPPTTAGQFGKGTVLVVVMALVLVPLYCIVVTSLSTQGAINQAGGLVLVPHGLTLDAYREVFGNGTVTRSLEVTFGITLVGTLISMVVSVLCAYGLSRFRSFGHRTILMVLIITMFVSGGLIPTFIVVTELGGYDQYWALILPNAVSVFNILVLRSFFSSTSTDLIDAARLDGAGEWRILWSVVLPTSRAVTAVIALFYAVGYWNTFFGAMLYMPTDQQKWPIQYVLYQYVNLGMTMPGVANSGYGGIHQQAAPLSLSMAVVVLTLLPILIVYPFVQKHFAKGMLTGAIKG
ncbi:carbohydrate ABC transporter permease [Actinocrinis puniceicyclus]|uniref:Carbohydrate ABC transporter permease n=1 Tax=Actinocrinis puniceicyclus TaxID=977794 RepID=A0A8J7WSY1_9ACTN|nr:carbohydrate ABC transporter permease [Actinocrinis puniceicyclus]MBS2965100.1 carbohydrate ABC transporter permease [Actinocrinis puniceicyclus]